MKNSILKTATILVFALAIISCSKDGEPGAAGTNGTNGIAGTLGAAGTNGTNGTNGQPGTANVIYSNWIPADFTYTTTGTTANRKYMVIPFPSSVPIQSDILNKYVVLVYFMGFGDGSLYMLPCNFRGANFMVQPNLSFGFLITATSEGSSPLSPFAIDPVNNNRFRYVLIPGGTLGNRGVSKPDYSKMSYKEICTKFNIPE